MMDLGTWDISHHPSTPIPAVSVLMPCYNVTDVVDEAIESVLGQTLGDLELVAVDDGSTDSTPARLLSWASRDQRIRSLRLPHPGIIPTLNVGLGACRAPLIARMDADDYAHPERLAKQVTFLADQPDLAVVGCLVEPHPNSRFGRGFELYIEWLNGLVTPEDIARELFIESPLAHPSVVMRLEWIERVGGYRDRGWPEDYDLWLRLYLARARFAKVPEALLFWRESPERLTRTDSRYSAENFLRAKAYYLARGPLRGRDAVIVWGAGQMGRRLSKHLLCEGGPLVAFVDIDPAKIGRTRKDPPIIAPQELSAWLARYERLVILAAVGSRGARAVIRQRLGALGLVEGFDWWAVSRGLGTPGRPTRESTARELPSAAGG